jgi:hypothetical protein
MGVETAYWFAGERNMEKSDRIFKRRAEVLSGRAGSTLRRARRQLAGEAHLADDKPC